MKDRESTNILANGAVRYGIYDDEGTLLRYEYIKLEDEPSEGMEGSIYNRANVLPDAVTDLLDLDEDSEPKDAFLALRAYAGRQRASTFEKIMMGRVW